MTRKELGMSDDLKQEAQYRVSRGDSTNSAQYKDETLKEGSSFTGI